MSAYWHQKQLRMLQTVLRETDIVGYDAKAIVQYLLDTNSNAIIVNAGGIIDFFPAEGKLRRKNAFRTDEDVLRDLTQECHKHDIAVMVRIDFRGVEQSRYEEQPDWFAQDAEGRAKIGYEGRIYKPCYNGVYPNENAVHFIRDMMGRYDVDGIWENSVGFGDGPCYCKTCRDKFRADTGKEIPVAADYASDIFAQYREWKAGCADAHLRLMRDTVKSFGPHKAYCAEIFGMFHASNALQTGIDLYNAKDYFDFLVSPAFLDGAAQPTKKYDDLSYAASSMKFLRAISTDKQIVLLYGNNGTKWRLIKAPTVETRVWMWEAAAVGAGFWNCMFNGQYPGNAPDRRNAGIETPVYTYLKDNEKLLASQTPLVDVGLYFSKPSRDTFGRDSEDADRYGVFIKGTEQMLLQHHVQYNFIPDLGFTLAAIKHLKALILPNAACISDEQAQIIREYVEQGGGLIASYETSLYDENGRRRPNFALADLFGCDFTGMRRDTSMDCYQRVVSNHEIFKGMDIGSTDVIMNEGETLLCTVRDGDNIQVPAAYIPRIFNQPPEMAWIPNMETEYPTVTAVTYGKGHVVYFANQTDKLCYTNGHEDFYDTFYNALEWVKNAPLTLQTEAPSSVHVTLTRSQEHPSEYILSFVNATLGSTRPARELVTVQDIRSTLHIGGTLKGYKTLYGQCDVVSDGHIDVSVSALKDFAAISLTIE